MAIFKLSNTSNPKKIFLISRSEIEGRLEAEYYRPEISTLEGKVRSKTSKRLKDYIVKIASGATPSVKEFDKYYSDAKNGIPFLRVQNLQTNGKLYLEDVKHINKPTHEKYLKRSQVEGGDLLVKITGVGRMAIAAVSPEGFVGNTNQHMVVIKTKSREVSEYLANYLNLDLAEKLATRRATGATRPALDYLALKSIPIIDGIDFSILFEAEKQKRIKELEAQRLSENIGTYLLNELGIDMISLDNSLRHRTFTTKLGGLTGGRIDPDYGKMSYKNISSAISKGRFPTEPLRFVTSLISSGNTPSARNYSDEITDYPIIKVGSYSNEFVDLKKCDYSKTELKLFAQKGDIFILSAAHQAEYIGRHIKYLNENPDQSTSWVGELICVRGNEKCNSMYLFSLLELNYYKTLINREKTGQTSHIYAKDIRKIRIPLPPIEKQDEIAAEIQRVRKEIENLYREGSSIVDNAKLNIENNLISK